MTMLTTPTKQHDIYEELLMYNNLLRHYLTVDSRMTFTLLSVEEAFIVHFLGPQHGLRILNYLKLESRKALLRSY